MLTFLIQDHEEPRIFASATWEVQGWTPMEGISMPTKSKLEDLTPEPDPFAPTATLFEWIVSIQSRQAAAWGRAHKN
jgi:hypothetical protein